jgi:hypothetical protein
MPLILRAVKGSKLSISEMDGNLTYLSSTLSGSVIQVTGSSIDAPNTSITASAFIGSGSGIIGVISSSYANSSSWSPTPNLESVLTVGSNLVNSYTISSTETLNIQTNFDSQIGKIATDTNYVELSAISGSNSSSIKITGNNIIITGSLFVSNSINSNNRFLYDSTGIDSIGWENRVLYDSTENDSIDWENRILKGTFANSVIEWTDTNLQPSLDDVINLGDSSNRWRNTYISRGLYVGAVNNESILTGGGLKLPTQSATPVSAPTHGDGTITVGKNAGSYFIYVYLDNQWRSASLS